MIIIKKPIISEKSMKLAKDGLYTFEVAREASKPVIAKAMALKFNVKVISVKVINVIRVITDWKETMVSGG